MTTAEKKQRGVNLDLTKEVNYFPEEIDLYKEVEKEFLEIEKKYSTRASYRHYKI